MPPPSVACLECGEAVVRTKRITRQYCSDGCYRERKRRLRREKPKPTCARCGDEFVRTGNRQKFCPPCQKIRAKEYAEEYSALNADKIAKARREYMRQRRLEDPEAARARDRAWREANKGKVNALRRTPEYRDKALKRVKERYRTEPKVALRFRMRSAMNQALRERKSGRKWESLVGYTVNDLIKHLERQFTKGMSWNNMGDWHIDHIIPKSSFSYESENDPEFKAAWALTNLRPLWKSDNQKKHAKRLHLI